LHLEFEDTFIEQPSGTSENGMLTFAAILFFETPTVGLLLLLLIISDSYQSSTFQEQKNKK
jgi:hypothetical protein